METVSPPILLAVLALVAWLALVLATDLRVARATGANGSLDEQALHAVAWTGRVGTRAILPAALVAAGAGVLAAQRHDWDLRGPWWFDACIALWLVAFVASTVWRAARARLVAQLATKPGEEAAEDAQWVTRQLGMLARGEVATLTLMVALVLLQPR